MNRKSLPIRVAAILLGAATAAWVLGNMLEPPQPSPVSASRPEPRGGPAPDPRRAPAALDGDLAADLAEARAAAPVAQPSSERPRPAGEWQGMKVDEAETWPCGERCGMARACVGGECVPCREDAECEAGEACVLDHCVLEEQVECRRAADCGDPEALCVLTGYTSGDLRGNRDMRAHCSHPEGGLPDELADEGAAPDEDDGALAAAPPLDGAPRGSSILDELRRRARRP